MMHSNRRAGFGMMEILIVIAAVATVFFGFLQTEIIALRLLQSGRQDLESSLLAEEGIEAVRAARDESWAIRIAPLTVGIPYYPIVENGVWKLSTSSPGLVNKSYLRYIQFSSVTRDAQDKIAVSGTADPNTRKVTSRVIAGRKEALLVSYAGGVTDANIANFPSTSAGDGDPAQSFTTPVGSSVPISSVDLLLKRITGTTPSDIYVEIRSVSTVGSVIGTSQLRQPRSIATTSLAWVKFFFLAPPTLTANTQYFLRLRSTPDSTVSGSGSKPLIHWGHTIGSGSAYAGGTAYRYVGKSGQPADQGTQLATYDFAFAVNKSLDSGRTSDVITYLTNFPDLLTKPKEGLSVSYEFGVTDTNLASFPSQNLGDGDPAQSFITLASAVKVTKVELLLHRTSASSSPIYVELRASSTTGTLLGTSQIISSLSVPDEPYGWTPFRFLPSVQLLANSKYYIRLRSLPSSTDAGSKSVGSVNWGYLQSGASGPYASGEAYRYIGKLSNPADAGSQLAQYDYSFRVFIEQ